MCRDIKDKKAHHAAISQREKPNTLDKVLTEEVRMRFKILLAISTLAVFYACTGITAANAQFEGLVTLRNVSAPYTTLEVGQTLQVDIVDARPFSTVWFTYDNDGVLYMGCGADGCQTDGVGNWTLVVGPIGPEYVGFHEEHWYVGDTPDDVVEVFPNNPDDGLAYAPHLPTFRIARYFQGTNCPDVWIAHSACSEGNTVRFHLWQPLVFFNFSSLVSIVTEREIANDLNAVLNGKVSITENPDAFRMDFKIQDGGGIPDAYAITRVSGEDCNPPCDHRMTDDYGCNPGFCLNNSVFYSGEITLMTDFITSKAELLQLSPSYVAGTVLEHEFGHIILINDTPIPLDPGTFQEEFNGNCSKVQGIMQQGNIELNISCGKQIATSCDSASILPTYGDFGAPYCDIFQPAFCNPDSYC
jgi:hypothetical protein